MATRRGFLQGVAAGSVLVGCRGKEEDTGEIVAGLREEEPEIWSPSGTEDRDLFPYGVRVGDATTDSAIVAIYTTEDVSSVPFEVQKADGKSWVADQEGTVEVGAAGHGQAEITGLEADTAYAIVFYNSDGSKRSQVTRFRTALDDDSWRIVSFGATSCLGGNVPWPNLTQAKNDKYDFFCMLGDTVYAEANSFAGFWDYWDYVLRQDGLYDLFSSTSMIATWDDHEITNNFSWDAFPNAQDKFEAAITAFRQGLPQREGDNGAIWRSIKHGKVLEVFVLDCRGERRDGQYISDEQMAWLKEGLSASTARFKIILNSVPIVDFEPLIGDAQADDRWQGFPAQREEILGYIEDSTIEGVLWITGDFHFGSISRVSPAGSVGDSMYEVMAGPSGSFLNPMGNLITTEQYLLAFSEWNHTRFVCNPDTGEVLVQFVGDTGDIIEEMSLMI